MKMLKEYKPARWFIFAVAVGILLLLAADTIGFFEGIDNYLYDLSFRIRGPLKTDNRIIIAAIDEKTLENLGRWPLDRIHYARLIDHLKEASAVGLDIIMAEPARDDPELSAAMANYGKVVLPSYVEGNSRISCPSSSLTSYKTGHVHIEQGVDGIIRKVFHRVDYQGHSLPSFASVLYETATGSPFDRHIVKTTELHHRKEEPLLIIQGMPMNINYYGPPGTFPMISFVDIVRGQYVSSAFKNKIMLVGITAQGIEDNKLIPFTQSRNRISGVEVQANILNNLLDKNAVLAADERLRLSFLLFISLLCTFLFMKLGEKAAAFLWISGIISVSAAGFFLFVFQNLWFDPTLFYCSVSFLYVTVYLLKLDNAARQLDMKYLAMNARIGQDMRTNEKTGQEKGLLSFLSYGGINTKIQRLLKIEQQYQEKLENTVQKTTEELRKSEAELQDSYNTQAFLNMILSESLEDVPLELVLQKAVNMVTAIPWLPIGPAGSILLVEDKPDMLVMKAQINLDGSLCSEVPFGRYLCGQAALTREMQFSDHPEEYHEACREKTDGASRGHYAVPILYGGRTLGVLNIYLQEGQSRDKAVEEFLSGFANTLSGIIQRKKAEHAREKLHAQLLQAQKMEAVGQLAGGIAHDFNNILSAIIGYTHLLKMKMPDDDPLRMYPDHVLSLSDRAANLTQSLLAFSRKQITNPKPENLNEIIRTVEKLLLRIIGEDIHLKTTTTGEELIVMADSGQMEQMMMNFATNARDAMPAGGLLSIRTETIDLDNTFIREHGFGKEGKYALISVTDTGAGMDKETRERIFEPFFTTKETGKGTGLGLAMVFGIIKQHNGYINVYSEPGRGTTFRIYLPLIQDRAEQIERKELQPLEPGTETLLLAEDNTDVRLSMKQLLEEFGYTIIEAEDGEDAIRKFELYNDKIQLVLLDVVMPKKNGNEAYEDIKKIRPDIKVLFMSGYTADIILKKSSPVDGMNHIEKPVTPSSLLKKIREVLRG